MELIFKFSLLANIVLSIFFWCLSYIDSLWLSEEEIVLLNQAGAGGLLPYSEFWYWGSLLIWLSLSVGMYLFSNVARVGFVIMYLVSFVLILFNGIQVLTPIEFAVSNVIGFLDGLILTIAYLTTINTKFTQNYSPPPSDEYDDTVGPAVKALFSLLIIIGISAATIFGYYCRELVIEYRETNRLCKSLVVGNLVPDLNVTQKTYSRVTIKKYEHKVIDADTNKKFIDIHARNIYHYFGGTGDLSSFVGCRLRHENGKIISIKHGSNYFE